MSLDAGDDFLKQRVMNLPESEVAGTHNTEEGGWNVKYVNVFTRQMIEYFNLLLVHCPGIPYAVLCVCVCVCVCVYLCRPDSEAAGLPSTQRRGHHSPQLL